MRATLPALLFFLLGVMFVNCAGIQTDEAYFAAPLFREWHVFAVPLGRFQIPLMNGLYLGALKTWLYAPLLVFHAVSPALIRIPAVAFGAVTILIFWRLLYRVHGLRAAVVGCVLLATDAMFLLTTTFDWGPVALQHLCMVAAMWLAVRWYQGAGRRSLELSAFCCGLAFWDKAVFLWMFSGILAGLLLFLPDLRRRLTWRLAAGAATALCLGALPLIVYNLAPGSRLATLHSNPGFGAGVTRAAFRQKFEILRGTLDGEMLFGYLVNEDFAPGSRPPDSGLERASFELRRVAGEHRRSLMIPAYCVGLLLLPVLWRTRVRKPMLFCLVAMAVAWIHMGIAGQGGSSHHAILLWPLPQLFLAVALAEASQRVRFGKPALAVGVAILAFSNLLVINQYRYQFARDGAGFLWTDAIYPLARALQQMHASQIFLPDWGMIDSLCVLDRDNPHVLAPDDSFLAPDASPARRQADLEMTADANAVWVLHTLEYEVFKGVNGRILSKARLAGFVPVMPQTYYDGNGRAIFQSFRFARSE